jgi:hypothetical protein
VNYTSTYFKWLNDTEGEYIYVEKKRKREREKGEREREEREEKLYINKRIYKNKKLINKNL